MSFNVALHIFNFFDRYISSIRLSRTDVATYQEAPFSSLFILECQLFLIE
jgi:hypothetical protein